MSDYHTTIKPALDRAHGALERASRIPAKFRHAGIMFWLDQCENVLHANELCDTAMTRLVETYKMFGYNSVQFQLSIGNWWLAHGVLIDAIETEKKAFLTHSDAFYAVFPVYP